MNFSSFEKELGFELVETFAAELTALCLRLLGFGEFDVAVWSTAAASQFGLDSFHIADLPDLCLFLLGFGEFDFAAAVSKAAANQFGFDSFDIAATEGIAVAVAIVETAGTAVPVPPYSAVIASAALVFAATVQTDQMPLHLYSMMTSALSEPVASSAEDTEAHKLGNPTFAIHFGLEGGCVTIKWGSFAVPFWLLRLAKNERWSLMVIFNEIFM